MSNKPKKPMGEKVSLGYAWYALFVLFLINRLLRDAKLYEIGAGTSEIRRMLIGRELFAETAPL